MIPVCHVDALADGAAVRISADVPIAVFRAEGELYAVDDTCTHQDASLADGYVEGCWVECPLHASTFDLRTGRPNGPPAKLALRTHTVTVQDSMIYVLPATSAAS
ncbi:MAG: bifunctional 3-phenylpropionate/cinnamic acid dioxygenase ferredoxin subunit [Frankiales bacterium]|nr:bifunctional 3-phenylpropionate/cinnamic acid dioxygenase ferredoxin subunit [Frankiales bacterium]